MIKKNSKRYFKQLIAAILILQSMAYVNLFAQPSVTKLKQALDNEEQLQPKGRSLKIINSTQASILFETNTTLRHANAISWLSQQFVLRPNLDQLLDENRDVTTGSGYSIKKIHQYYKGIKVEHGVINATSKNGRLAMMQLEYYPIPDKFSIVPQITEQQALEKAMAFTGSKIFAWSDGADTTSPDNKKPAGELVIIATYKKEGEVCLAYKFNIYAVQPLMRAWVYVDAKDGRIVLDDAIIKHAENEQSLVSSINSTDEAIPLKFWQLPSPAKIDLNRWSISYPATLPFGIRNYLSPWSLSSLTKMNLNPWSESSPATINPLKPWSVFTPPTIANKENNLNHPLTNIVGTAATRYYGSRTIITDKLAAGGANPYRLRQKRGADSIVTLDFQRKPNNTQFNFDVQAIDFMDDDNLWTAREYDNANVDNAALDAHINVGWVSDYWNNIHQRRGWDNNNSPFIAYVHTAENKYDVNNVFVSFTRWYNNAFWNGKNLHLGDGNGSTKGPKTYLDVIAHELGHAITSSTCNLVYRWESGAMNEAFSDIWGACVTNYAIKNDPTIQAAGDLIWRHGERADLPGTAKPGTRDLQNPLLFSQPSTYKSTFWKPGNYEECPVDIFSGPDQNDHCGVHTNSGILNKWFFLITQGETFVNTQILPYDITGLGFEKTEKIAYLMEQNLTPNASYATAMNVSTNIAAVEYGWASAELSTIRQAWKAVGVDSSIYNTANTTVFETNNFTSIASVGNTILAGTNYSGLYKYDGIKWEKLPELTDVRFNDIKADENGDFWIAQSGRLGQTGGGSSIAGGVNFLPNPYTGPTTLYTVGAQQQLPSRNARSIYIDQGRVNEGVNTRLWVATLAYFSSSVSVSGKLGLGLFTSGNSFKTISEGINVSSGTVGCLTVGGSKFHIWTFVQANNGINQLLQYNAATSALLKTYDHNSEPALPSGFVARAIYGDRRGRMWFGLANGGVMVLDESKSWHQINFSDIFPAGTAVNYNAITGDPYGDIYIGTTSGIVFFDANKGEPARLTDPAAYRRYTKANGLPSSNINAIYYSDYNFKVYVATDSGIVFWEPLCIGDACDIKRYTENSITQTNGPGNWSNPAVWSSGKIPDSTTSVVITDTITVDVNAKCLSLTISNPGNIIVNTGIDLKIFETAPPIMDDRQKK